MSYFEKFLKYVFEYSVKNVFECNYKYLKKLFMDTFIILIKMFLPYKLMKPIFMLYINFIEHFTPYNLVEL